MCSVFRILSSKLDHKLNHPRRVRTILRSKVNIYGTIIRRVYGEYTTTSFFGNFCACANISYQAAFPPPPSWPGYKANYCVAVSLTFTSRLLLICRDLLNFEWLWRVREIFRYIFLGRSGCGCCRSSGRGSVITGAA